MKNRKDKKEVKAFISNDTMKKKGKDTVKRVDKLDIKTKNL
jgi:hypothetical protein